MKVKVNPKYKHYSKYKNMIQGHEREIINICLEMYSKDEYKKFYELDENLNNKEIMRTSKKVNPKLIERKKEKLKKKLERELKKADTNTDIIIKLTKEYEKEIRNLNSTYKKWDRCIFDDYIQEIANIVYKSLSLADITCICKHVIRYHILKIDRPKTFIKE